MTLPEIALYLAGDPDKRGDTIDYAALARFRQMTPLERLEQGANELGW